MSSISSSTARGAEPATEAWRPKWRLYALEALLLGTFMLSACVFASLIEHPASPLHGNIPGAFARRALMGVAMGATAVALIYSPAGKRSGAHMNPAMTLSFLRLGRIDRCDAAGYIAGQFVGGAAGVALVTGVAHAWVSDPSVRFVATIPGSFGLIAAWAGEFVIAFVLVAAVLAINKKPKLAPYTGWFAGLLVALCITFEAPLSGMSMNPARTFASAFSAKLWTGWWIYLTAPVLGMLAAVEVHVRLGARPQRLCGRLSHDPRTPTPFKCQCLEPQGQS